MSVFPPKNCFIASESKKITEFNFDLNPPGEKELDMKSLPQPKKVPENEQSAINLIAETDEVKKNTLIPRFSFESDPFDTKGDYSRFNSYFEPKYYELE